MANGRAIHAALSEQGIRLFQVVLGNDDVTTLIHMNKSVADWRNDVREIIQKLGTRETAAGEADASDVFYNEFFAALAQAGYEDVSDVVADVFEGRIESNASRLTTEPLFELTSDESAGRGPDGFGHYGWEARQQVNKPQS